MVRGASDSTNRVTRRDFVKRSLVLVAGTITFTGLLEACAPAPAPQPTRAAAPAAQATTAPAAQPTKPAAQATAAPAAQATTAPTAVAKPATQGGTLVVAGEALGDNYLPGVTFQGRAHWWATGGFYETLYSLYDFKAPSPTLATGYTVSDDGLTYTFQLRKGVKFHDGTPFNAEAVEFQYMSALDKNHPYYNADAVYTRTALPFVKTVKAKDEYTVEIVRTQPGTAFLASLSVPYAGFQSPTVVKKYGVKDAPRYPVGTGPFVFEKGEKGAQVSMTAFPDYWGGRPALDRVVVRAIPDQQAMTASLMAGEVDLALIYIDFKDLPAFRKNANLKVQVIPAAITGYLGPNQQHETMKDVRVRKALAHSINKQKIIDTIFYGEADIAAGLTPLGTLGNAPQFKDYYKYDPQKAKDLLKDAGAAPEFTLWTQTSGYWPQMAELLQSDFNAVGFKASIEKIDPARFYTLASEGKHHVFVGDGSISTNDPEDIYFIFFGCQNNRAKRWGYCDPKFDEILNQQSAERDPKKREQMLWDLQKMLLDNVAQIYNYYGRYPFVMNKRVEGFNPLPIPWVYLNKTSLTK
ncbi:MAG: hypothetical protein HY331_04460 [Chloroflexi bacterium]|nr:hypothetical protein [Chloroflexota bacterium]